MLGIVIGQLLQSIQSGGNLFDALSVRFEVSSVPSDDETALAALGVLDRLIERPRRVDDTKGMRDGGLASRQFWQNGPA